MTLMQGRTVLSVKKLFVIIVGLVSVMLSGACSDTQAQPDLGEGVRRIAATDATNSYHIPMIGVVKVICKTPGYDAYQRRSAELSMVMQTYAVAPVLEVDLTPGNTGGNGVPSESVLTLGMLIDDTKGLGKAEVDQQVKKVTSAVSC